MARHKIRGKVWDMRYVPNMEMDGWCDSPDTKNKQIRIAKRCKGLRRLIVLLHEALHAGLWDIDEDAIEELAEDAGRLLWKELELKGKV